MKKNATYDTRGLLVVADATIYLPNLSLDFVLIYCMNREA